MNERPAFVTLGSTVSAAENIVNWLKAELEGEKQPDRVEKVERHIGQFNTPDQVKSYMSGRGGSIRIAALRVRNIQNRRGMTGLVTWAAYIMMADFWGYPRDARCEVIAGRLARRISCREAAAGMKAERMAENIAAENLWSGGLDNLGITMWAVTWEQEFRLDDEIDLSTLPEFLRLGATIVVNGKP
ncbi:TPA: hypothetical protein N2R10_005425, partial [Citrobacter freundii]|nr:hypothetical protein [Citrobacter freundii]HAU4583924.1 hypothetical protein [Citrobacter freundii]HAU4605785.1 hypothetical protein [Citrobacter freundii]HAU4654808.1 hypothetical protein [Citrobacter freundii]HAU4699038.1 hypothetical protein [Citrobacter freundii]